MHSKVIIASLVCVLAAGFGNAKAQNLTKGRLQKTEETACNAPNEERMYLSLSATNASAGSVVSASFVSDNYYSGLEVNYATPGLQVSIFRSKHVRVVTPAEPGMYYANIDAISSPFINHRVSVGTIYVYSDGTNAGYSTISASAALAKYYRNYAPQYNREMLFGPEYGGEPYDDGEIELEPIPFPGGPIFRGNSKSQTPSFANTPSAKAGSIPSIPNMHALITKTDIEKDYADFVYGNDDVDTYYQLTPRTSIGLETTIRVHVNWYDEDLNAHPLKGVNVGFFRLEQKMIEMYDPNTVPIFFDPLADRYTDENGEYSIDYISRNGSETIEQIDVKFYSKSRATVVKDGVGLSYPYIYNIPSNIDPFGFTPYGIDLNRYICDYEAIDYYVDFFPFLNDRSAAYLVTSAQNIPFDYSNAFNADVEPVTTSYPAHFTSYNPASSAGKKITVEACDYNNFDVLNHEYAHYICDELNLCNISASRQKHNILEDLIVRYGDEEGLKLAYSEGLATYIALASQMYGASNSTIPGVGDMVYSDPNRNVSVDYNMYKPAGNNVTHYEGVESSVTAFMLKALDSTNRPFDYVAFGHAAMWNIIKRASRFGDGTDGIVLSMLTYASAIELDDEVEVLATKEGLPLNY